MPFLALQRIFSKFPKLYQLELRRVVLRDLLYLTLVGDILRLLLFSYAFEIKFSAPVVANTILFTAPGLVLYRRGKLAAASWLLVVSRLIFSIGYLYLSGVFNSSGLPAVIATIAAMPALLSPKEALRLMLIGLSAAVIVIPLKLNGLLPNPVLEETDLLRFFNLMIAIVGGAIPAIRARSMLADAKETTVRAESRFQLLFEHAPVAITIYEFNSFLPKKFNRLACQLAEMSPSDYAQASALDLFGVTEAELMAFRESARHGPKQLQARLKTPSGEWKDVWANWVVVNDEVFSVIRDITEQLERERQSKANLEEAELLSAAFADFWDSADDPVTSLKILLRRIKDFTPDICTVRLISEDRHSLLPTLTEWAPANEQSLVQPQFTQNLPLSEPYIQQIVAREGRTIYLKELTLDEPFFSPLQISNMKKLGTFSLLAVPIRADYQTIGVLMIARQRRDLGPLTERDRLFFENLAHRAAQAFDTMSLNLALQQEIVSGLRLRRENEESTRQLIEAIGKLSTAQEDERQGIARELHDELGHRLISSKMLLERCRLEVDRALIDKWLKEAAFEIESSIREVRDIASLLRPPVLDTVGLRGAIEALLAEVGRKHGLRCRPDIDDVEVTPTQKVAIYRLVQEAITNVLKHSGATSLKVTLKQSGGQLVLAIEDDGGGIANQSLPRSIQARCAQIGARLKVTSGAPRGTRLQITL